LRVIVKRIARELEITIEMRNAVEEGYLGLMVWRVQ